MSQDRIIIVDDDPDVVDRLTQLLEDDYDVVATTDWAQLNRLVFRDGGADLMLMDVNLPVLQGDQLVSILNRTGSKTAKRMPIYYYSSADEDTMQRLVRETGAAGYISKSVRAADLLSRISDAIEASRAVDDEAP